MTSSSIDRISLALRALPRSRRLSIVGPIVVISVALGILAYRSFKLSARMEHGLSVLAIQYLDFAAEITAQRADSAIRTEMFQAAEDWQQAERGLAEPTWDALTAWKARHDWIVSVMYIPDDDPTGSVFVGERTAAARPRETNEFFTATGTIRYDYEPALLLHVVRRAIENEPASHMARLPEAAELREESELAVIPTPQRTGLVQSSDTVAVIIPLSPPMKEYSIRASIRRPFVGHGWESHRVITAWLSIITTLLVAAAILAALRGLRREAETMRLRSALIANVSHELRTPLSMIRLGAETLKRGDKLSPQQRQDLQESILREVVHLSHLVENVLDIARLQKGSHTLVFTPIAPAELVNSVVSTYETLIRNKGFDVELDLASDIPDQLWDRESISRALLNLIDNAMKYSAGNKTIRIALRQTAESVQIAVEDKGIGIAPADVSRIFEPYYRAQFSDTETRRGAGLGLTLVQQIVQSHGGRIEVASQLGRGSTFTMVFPKRAAQNQSDKVLLAPRPGYS